MEIWGTAETGECGVIIGDRDGGETVVLSGQGTKKILICSRGAQESPEVRCRQR